MAKFKCEIVVWSRPGHTPLTHRNGQYCDELVRKFVMVADHKEAETKARKVMSETIHSDRACFYIPKLPNQNYRTMWL